MYRELDTTYYLFGYEAVMLYSEGKTMKEIHEAMKGDLIFTSFTPGKDSPLELLHHATGPYEVTEIESYEYHQLVELSIN